LPEAGSIQYIDNKRAHSYLPEPGKSESVLPKAAALLIATVYILDIALAKVFHEQGGALMR
jgi:hypothetical protein